MNIKSSIELIIVPTLKDLPESLTQGIRPTLLFLVEEGNTFIWSLKYMAKVTNSIVRMIIRHVFAYIILVQC